MRSGNENVVFFSLEEHIYVLMSQGEDMGGAEELGSQYKNTL